MLKTIAFTAIAGLVVGVMLPVAMFGSHKVIERFSQSPQPRAEVDLQAHKVEEQPPAKQTAPVGANYSALAGAPTTGQSWTRSNGRVTRARHSRKRRFLDTTAKRNLASADHQAWVEADRMLRSERSGM